MYVLLSVWLLLHSIVSVHFVHVVTWQQLIFLKKFFLFGCTGSSLLCGLFSRCGEWGSCLVACRVRASHCGGFSSSAGCRVCRLQWLWLVGSRAQAQQLWRTGLVAPWRVGSSQTRTKPMSPAWAGRFLSTVPPEKSQTLLFTLNLLWVWSNV